MKPVVAQEPLDVVDHRPVEEEIKGVVVVPEARFERLAGRCAAHPEVTAKGRADRLAESALDVAEGAETGDSAGREAADLGLAAFVVIPELDA